MENAKKQKIHHRGTENTEILIQGGRGASGRCSGSRWRRARWRSSRDRSGRCAGGVPNGRRNPAAGEVLHDDLLIDAELCTVLCAELDALYWAGKIALGLANAGVVAGRYRTAGRGTERRDGGSVIAG